MTGEEREEEEKEETKEEENQENLEETFPTGYAGGTMQIIASLEKRAIMILLNNVSSHSFMNSSVAEGLKNKVVYNKPLIVVVANGHKVTTEKEGMRLNGGYRTMYPVTISG